MFLKSSSHRNIKQINRLFFFPLLKFLFDKPTLKNSENIIKFQKNELISFKYYDDEKNTVYLKLDDYNVCHGIFPKYDIIGRKLKTNLFTGECKTYVNFLIKTKKYRISNTLNLYKVVKRFRKENVLLKEYLNLYMPLYSEFGNNNINLLHSKDFSIQILNKLRTLWIPQSDLVIFKKLKEEKNLEELNKLIAISAYLYYQDSRILNKKILAFNTRNINLKLDKNDKNEFRRTPLDILGYSILRQKLRTKLTIVALCSFLNIKYLLLKNK